MVKLKDLSRVINACVVLAAAGISISGVAFAAEPKTNLTAENSTNEERQMAESNAPVTTPFGIAGLGIAPLVMLTVGREHNLFSEAYSDYTDIDGDGKLDIMFDPSISYFGLFDDKLCYKYQSGLTNLQNPPSNSENISVGWGTYTKFPGYWYPYKKAGEKTASLNMWGESRTVKVCQESDAWSGNFLNYLTSSRIDVVRKVLYGGARVYSSSKGSDLKAGNAVTTKFYKEGMKGKGSSLLAHSRVIRDSHAWGKVLSDLMYDGAFTVSDFTGLQNTGSAENAWFFVVASPDDSKRESNDDSNTGNSFRWTSTYMRYALVTNAGIPGRAPAKTDVNYSYIWDWASRQTYNQDTYDAIGSANQKKIDRTQKANGSQVLGENLFDASTLGTRNIAVVACTDEFHDNDNCMNYGTEAEPIWQPTGLLQQYGQGASPRMRFGLMTGGWESNISGGILRANIGDFNSEIRTASSGNHYAGDYDFSKIQCDTVASNDGKGALCGIVAAFDRMNISGKQSGSVSGPNGSGVYNKCERTTTRIRNMYNETHGSCHDWGNPIGEILYETARYFGGKEMYVDRVTLADRSSWEENQLKMGHVKATDPYPEGSSTYCAKPISLLIADENISFDGASSSNNPYAGNGSAVEAETGAVSQEYGLSSGSYYMGGVKGVDSGMYEFIPSRKQISNLNQVVGIAPAAAFAAGTYNVAGVASMYSKNPVRTSYGPNDKSSDLYMSTYVVAMKPNLPQINIPITTDSGTVTVEILPFAKTPVEDDSDVCKAQFDSISRQQRIVQSTNQVADFYVESLNDNEGVFRVSYEDFEYGSDYDMDWVVGYKYQVLRGASGDYYVRLMLTHEDGDPYKPQHAGYVITGVENEGVFVDIGKLSSSNSSGCYPNLYELDTFINDASIDSCKGDSWKLISADGKRGLTDVVEAGKSGGSWPGDLCLFPTWDYSEKNYTDSGYWSTGNIDKYYDTFIAPHADIYYANRRTLVEKGYWQYARFKDFGDEKQWNYRIHGDRYSSMGKVAAKNGTSVTTSRVFKVRNTAANTYATKASTSGDTGSGWLKSPLWFAAKYGINPKQNPSRSNPNVEPDNYYLVTNPIKLRDGIAEMLGKIDQSVKSGSSFSFSTGGVTNGGDTYAVVYDPASWYGSVAKVGYNYKEKSSESGDAEKFVVNYIATEPSMVRWSADETFAAMNPDDRVVITFDAKNSKLTRLYAEETKYDSKTWDSNKSSYVAFSKSSGAVGHMGYDVVRQLLNETSLSDADVDDPDYLVYADKLVRWVLGDHTYEGINSSENISLRLANNENKPLRPRNISIGTKKLNFVLGDIINSNAYVFKINGKVFIGVGANDGMLHIIDDTNGKPVVSYMPSVALGSIGKLVKENYNSGHFAFVDSTIEKLEVGSKTYLYGTYGLGMKGAYLLDVTNINSAAGISNAAGRSKFFTETNPLLVWEIREDLSKYIGKQRKAPSYMKILKNPGVPDSTVHYLAFGSGYDAEKQGLLFVDMFHNGGECIRGDKDKFEPCVVSEIDLTSEEFNAGDPWGYGRKNAFTGITPISSSFIDDAGWIINALYWGDLFGNVWKIDLDAVATAQRAANKTPTAYYDVTNWGKTHYEPKIIFRATDQNGVAQPITADIQAAWHPNGGIGLIFGTGALWTSADQGTVSLKYNTNQTLYMIRDMNSADPTINASNREDDNLVHRCVAGDAVSNPNAGCLFEYGFSSGDVTQIQLKLGGQVPTHATKVYGWYLDLADANGETYEDGARIYRNPLIVNSYNIAVPVNIPNVSDTCNGGGSSYIIDGDWTLRNFNMVISRSETFSFLLNEGTVENAEGGVAAIFGTETVGDGQVPGNVGKFYAEPTVRSSSWLKLY
ncbi:MAG: hypothetical protein J6I35_07435 [Ruminobacter sp.]|uniref:pilus assembly protein n=1 Tax=Ruminobacter sp. TaxID=2774296 RepID=UPI001B6FF4C9|nr:PilC/PilY family type IV pilus protein [Ruminobacter sp.]MBP3749363.1 hypothetical protein [Ruminobacter sp.]